MPSHYQWSPRGYIYVDGYYDYSLARRGILFAPVYFNPSVYARQGFTYSPAIAISMAVFGNQLFLRPNYGHYYFGDFYGSNYSTAGYYPWFSFNSGGYGYDPIYAQQFWQNRKNAAWAQNVQTDFQNRVDNDAARPPRTLAAQQALIKTGDTSNEKNLIRAMSLDQLAKSQDNTLQLQAVSKVEQQKMATHGHTVHKFSESRQKLETSADATSVEKSTKDGKPVKLKHPPSPILAKATDKAGDEHDAPKIHDAPPFDSKVEPKSRQPVEKVPPKTTKAEPKSESPRDKPKRTPRDQTNPDVPKVEPKPTPKVEPKPTPKVEPKPTPKVEPKPTPKVEPKPEPPRDKPSDTPREKPRDKPRDKPRSEEKEKPKK